MSKQRPTDAAPSVTPQRAGRLFRLVTLTAESARTRKTLVAKLRVDLRGFYRDLELLRSLGIDIASDADKYQLVGAVDDALAKLPFPDPGLSFRDVLALSRGTGDAHKKLRRRMETFTGTNGTHAPK